MLAGGVEFGVGVEVFPGPVEGAGAGDGLQVLAFEGAGGGQAAADVPGGVGFVVDE